MNYKSLIVSVLLIFLSNCTTYTKKNINIIYKKNFTNQGFTLIYNNDLYINQIVSKRLDNRGLIISQRNLPEGTSVVIKNLLNNKSIVAKVGSKSKYPIFNNSVITQKIAQEINLDLKEPYIEISEILHQKYSIIKKTKTYNEEKKVANKAPVDIININNIGIKVINKTKKKSKFKYTIKIADFYFKNSADAMIAKINTETSAKNVSLDELSKTEYRVFLGPFYDLSSLQIAFNDIKILQFENIEIIKND
jgi:hypothetical protein